MTIRFPDTPAIFNCKILFLVCLLLFSCQKEKPLDFWLTSEHQARLQLSFAGFDLTGQGMPASDAPGTFMDLWGSGRPYFEREGNLLCIKSHRPFFYAREMGVRFRFCTGDSAAVDYNSVVASFSDLKDPLYSSEKIQLTRTNYRKLARSLKNVEIVLSGNPTINAAQNEKLLGQLNFYSAFPLNDQTLDYNPLPWSFENQSFDIIVTDTEVLLLYPDQSDLLMLTVRDEELSRAFSAGLREIPAILRSMTENAKPVELFVSEFSTADNFLELAATKETPWQRARIQLRAPDGYTFSEERFFFAGGVHVYRNVPVEGLELQQGFSYTLPSLIETKNRSMERSAPLEEFRPSILCSTERCHSEGMLIASVDPDPSFCSIADLKLNEVNVSGIKTEHAMDPTGKFLEILALRNCRPDGILLVFDGQPLNLGDPYKKGEIRLFSAGQSYFSQPYVLDGRLRSLSSGSHLRFVDLGRHQEKSQDIPPGKYLFADGSPASLVLGENGYSFHTAAATAIRPDLRPHHMSPGQPNPVASVHPEAVSLTEIMPRSLQDAHGFLHSEEEYIELFINGESDLLYSLAVEADGSMDHYQISPGNARGYIVLSRAETATCLINHEKADISLPEKGEIRLSRAGALLSQLNWQAENDRRSLEKVRDSLFTKSSLPLSLCPDTHGTPGTPPAYDPFIHEAGGLQLESSVPLDLTIQFSGRTIESIVLRASPGLITLPAPNMPGQLFVDLSHEGRQLFRTEVFQPGPEIIIQTIAPTPLAGYEEWIRICATEPFQPQRLFLRDSSAEDEIVPWFTRKSIAPPSGLSGSQWNLDAGECAIIIDPDYSGHTLPLRPTDRALWTIQATTAIGNGLSSAESIMIFAENRNLAAYGQDGGLSSSSGEFVERTHGTGSARSFFEVRQ